MCPHNCIVSGLPMTRRAVFLDNEPLISNKRRVQLFAQQVYEIFLPISRFFFHWKQFSIKYYTRVTFICHVLRTSQRSSPNIDRKSALLRIATWFSSRRLQSKLIICSFFWRINAGLRGVIKVNVRLRCFIFCSFKSSTIKTWNARRECLVARSNVRSNHLKSVTILYSMITWL